MFDGERLITGYAQRLTYEADGHLLQKAMPEAVVYPETTAEVVHAVRCCHGHGVPFLARGAGTGLSGGAVAAAGGLLIEMARMNRILDVDPRNRTARVQPGLVNLKLSQQVARHGLRYAPDPSSQAACTIGGNIAENSGGPHTLKHGVTTNHVLALEVVLPDGEVLEIGHASGPAPGFDLTGLFVGSEGTFGIVTEATVRLIPQAAGVRTFLAVYDSIDDASETVSATLRAGIVPAAMELMDQLSIEAVESHLKVGFPRDAAAVLLIEIEGTPAELDALARRVVGICRENRCRDVQQARDEATRKRLWKGRKQALGAIGRIARSFYTHDGVVPRSKLPEMLRRIAAIGEKHGVRIANVCHAGDGNLHPMILFDPDDAEQCARVEAAGHDVLQTCVDLGGVLSGEHGIGQEKRNCMHWMFDEADLDQMRRVRQVFDPANLCNPGKVFPTGARCGEMLEHQARRTGGWL
ncbi:hypothetical protein ABI59_07115 [Acidobacteria bacterium Mor1]|nr:hypothetical protein ABI59_07115 [Acidobacteria bacterium Mor1]